MTALRETKWCPPSSCCGVNKNAYAWVMARLKRQGKTETFSVSVSARTRKQLKQAADRSYGGNVSALIEAIAEEAARHEALDWLIGGAPPIDERAYEAFLAEMAHERAPHERAGAKKSRGRRRAA